MAPKACEVVPREERKQASSATKAGGGVAVLGQDHKLYSPQRSSGDLLRTKRQDPLAVEISALEDMLDASRRAFVPGVSGVIILGAPPGSGKSHFVHHRDDGLIVDGDCFVVFPKDVLKLGFRAIKMLMIEHTRQLLGAPETQGRVVVFATKYAHYLCIPSLAEVAQLKRFPRSEGQGDILESTVKSWAGGRPKRSRVVESYDSDPLSYLEHALNIMWVDLRRTPTSLEVRSIDKNPAPVNASKTPTRAVKNSTLVEQSLLRTEQEEQGALDAEFEKYLAKDDEVEETVIPEEPPREPWDMEEVPRIRPSYTYLQENKWNILPLRLYAPLGAAITLLGFHPTLDTAMIFLGVLFWYLLFHVMFIRKTRYDMMLDDISRVIPEGDNHDAHKSREAVHHPFFARMHIESRDEAYFRFASDRRFTSMRVFPKRRTHTPPEGSQVSMSLMALAQSGANTVQKHEFMLKGIEATTRRVSTVKIPFKMSLHDSIYANSCIGAQFVAAHFKQQCPEVFL
jgi:hypothetical protein